jgi:hypothetical protein
MREEQDVRGCFLTVLRGATPDRSTFIDHMEIRYRHSCEGSLTSGAETIEDRARAVATETQAQPAQETLSTVQAQAIEEIV